MRLIILISGLLMALTACTPQVDRNAGPGIDFVSPGRAAALYKQVCVSNATNFENVPAVLAQMPFRQEPESGIYYHQDLNLSFRLGKSKNSDFCGMVWASVDPENANLAAIRSVAPHAQVEQTPIVGFFRAVIPERKTAR
ncbi:hypothetical protein [Parasulfitobacter algicola]|uniref:Lipoprotein n=1 Tax=Parasulfitobacter algicola TaxID=2614809 RepID=A0ABX2IX66_9RHOB|nr:hypothetical protein [Sulfitobacter algicola]NSX55059.1 hypothetical protein [Sulfitobacter algicola]